MTPNDTMLSALPVHASRPETAEKLRLFGQFVGAWDVDITHYTSEGPVHIELARPVGDEIVSEQMDLAESRSGWASETLMQEMSARRRRTRP